MDSIVSSAGIDTAKICWRLDVDSPAGRAADALATIPTSRARQLPAKINGHRVLWYPDAGLLAAEGHPAGADQLAAAQSLPDYVALTSNCLREFGIDVPDEPLRFDHSRHGFAGFGRLDVTVNLATDSTPTGLAIMSGVAAIQPDSRLQTIVTRQPGGRAIETVAWRGKRGIMARTYDKATEALSGPRATLLRFEDQHRWPTNTRRQTAELDASAVRDIFCKRFAPLWQASRGVQVVTTTKAAQRLRDAVRREDISAGQAIDVAGHLFLARAGVQIGSQPTRWRHRRIAQALGMVLVDGEIAEQEVDIDLAQVLEQVVDGNHWAIG
jgi:hypothetical protein